MRARCVRALADLPLLGGAAHVRVLFQGSEIVVDEAEGHTGAGGGGCEL